MEQNIKWFDSFEYMYDVFDNEESDFQIGDYRYTIQHYGNDEHPHLLHAKIKDCEHIPKGCYVWDEKYIIRECDYENSFDLVSNFTLMDGRTIAEMTCDANGWDRSILPVYPKWYSPLFGDTRPVDKSIKETEEEISIRRDKENLEFAKKEKREALKNNDMALFNELDEYEKLTRAEREKIEEEREKEIAQELRRMQVK